MQLPRDVFPVFQLISVFKFLTRNDLTNKKFLIILSLKLHPAFTLSFYDKILAGPKATGVRQ